MQSSRAWTYIQSTGGIYDQDWAQGGDKYLKTESKRKRKVIKPDGSVARPTSKTKAQPSRSYVPQDDGQDDSRRTAHFPAARENISVIRSGLGDKVKRGIHCQEGDTLSRGGYTVKKGDTLSRGGYTVKKGDIQSEGNIVERRKSLRGRIYQEEECLKRRVTLGRRETWDTLPSSGTVDTTNTQHKRYPHDRLRGGTEA